MLRSIGKQSVESVLDKKRNAAVGRILQKKVRGDGILIIIMMERLGNGTVSIRPSVCPVD